MFASILKLAAWLGLTTARAGAVVRDAPELAQPQRHQRMHQRICEDRHERVGIRSPLTGQTLRHVGQDANAIGMKIDIPGIVDPRVDHRECDGCVERGRRSERGSYCRIHGRALVSDPIRLGAEETTDALDRPAEPSQSLADREPPARRAKDLDGHRAYPGIAAALGRLPAAVGAHGLARAAGLVVIPIPLVNHLGPAAPLLPLPALARGGAPTSDPAE